MWRDATSPDPVFTDSLELDLGTVEPSLAGPKRPQDRVPLSQAAAAFAGELPKFAAAWTPPRVQGSGRRRPELRARPSMATW
jgi:aconitate hydratase